MGRVYRARMEAPGGASKQVALKVIHSHLAENRDFVLMFLDEMRLAMSLSHRNIVQTFDAGQIDEGYFMVMELVTGCSLRHLLDRVQGPLPLDIALFVGQEVAAALDYAHRFEPDPGGRRGVLHRDVSPGNILLSGEGDVKLTDFGVAKAAGRLYVTSPNLIHGKLRYMAPEQSVSQAEPRSDIFSLGAVLYEMITGRAMRGSGIEDLLSAQPPPPPSTLRAGLPAGLDALIAACVASSPARRPATAAEVRRALAVASFQLQTTSGSSLDPYARLQQFLSELDARPSAAPPAPGRLAQAVLVEARAVETDPELTARERDPSGSFSELAPTTLAPDTTADTVDAAMAGAPPAPAELPPDGGAEVPAIGRRWLGVALAVVLIGATAGAWLAFRASTRSTPRLRADAAAADARLDRPRPADTTARADKTPRPDMPLADASGPDLAAPRPSAARRGSQRKLGLLDINAVPWARVFIDGRFRGETPLEKVRLRAGAHQIRLVSPSRKIARTYTVEVVAGKRLRRVFTLQHAEQ